MFIYRCEPCQNAGKLSERDFLPLTDTDKAQCKKMGVDAASMVRVTCPHCLREELVPRAKLSPVAKAQFFLRSKNGRLGPYTLEQLQHFVTQGKLQEKHLVSSGGDFWAPAGKIEGLIFSCDDEELGLSSVDDSSASPAPRPATCPKCSSFLLPQAVICVNCGLRLATGEPVGNSGPGVQRRPSFRGFPMDGKPLSPLVVFALGSVVQFFVVFAVGSSLAGAGYGAGYALAAVAFAWFGCMMYWLGVSMLKSLQENPDAISFVYGMIGVMAPFFSLIIGFPIVFVHLWLYSQLVAPFGYRPRLKRPGEEGWLAKSMFGSAAT